MKYFVINDRKDRVVAVIGHDYLTSHYVCRSRSEAFTRALYGVARKRALGKLVTKKDHVVFNKFDPSYPMWMDAVVKNVLSNYWTLSKTGEIPNSEYEIDELVKKFFK